VIWRSAVRRAAKDVFAELTDRGLAWTSGEGQVAVAEPLLGLMDYFDSALTSILRSDFAVQEYRYPTLIPSSTLAACGYLASFPQHLMLVTRLHSDIDVYHCVRDQYGSGGQIDSSILPFCDNADYCLPPTMCFHTFSHYRGRRLDDTALTVVTAKGKSFRFESRYSTTMERLWDFTIREIVFLGTKDQVIAARTRLMESVFSYADRLGLTGYCEVGNDPFFCDPDTTDRVWAQRLLELKYELRLAIGEGRTTSAGSFNLHEDYFGTAFGITLKNGQTAFSGCAGFGLERLVFGFLCQYGLEPSGWPPEVARALAGNPAIETGRTPQ
jgi:seryl-tRNA synthetase